MPPNTIRRFSSPIPNGGDNTSTSNPLSRQYAPALQQLAFDLAHDRVADYNWNTPDQYNEMHSGLSAGLQA